MRHKQLCTSSTTFLLPEEKEGVPNGSMLCVRGITVSLCLQALKMNIITAKKELSVI